MSGARSKVSHFSPTFSNQNLYFKKGDIINEKIKNSSMQYCDLSRGAPLCYFSCDFDIK